MIFLKESDVLLFEGDSITHGGRKFSTWDQNHLIGHGYQDFVAQTLGLDNIERHPKIVNHADSGDDITMLIGRMDRVISEEKPTIVSILDGTNDATHHVLFNEAAFAPSEYDKKYRFLLDEALKRLPDLKLIICEPFRYASHEGEPDESEKKLIADVKERSEICRKIAKDYGAVFVPFWSALDKYALTSPITSLVWDGIHPTYVGHAVMAKCWLETVENEWNK